MIDRFDKAHRPAATAATSTEGQGPRWEDPADTPGRRRQAVWCKRGTPIEIVRPSWLPARAPPAESTGERPSAVRCS